MADRLGHSPDYVSVVGRIICFLDLLITPTSVYLMQPTFEPQGVLTFVNFIVGVFLSVIGILYILMVIHLLLSLCTRVCAPDNDEPLRKEDCRVYHFYLVILLVCTGILKQFWIVSLGVSLYAGFSAVAVCVVMTMTSREEEITISNESTRLIESV